MIELQKLPYDFRDLEPNIDAKTVETHYTKHHQGYVNKLNGLIVGTEFENMDLENIIKGSSKGIFNNAAQVWNHTFYWNGLTPGGSKIEGKIKSTIEEKRGNLENFKKEFFDSATGNFGSGWTWLVKDDSGNLKIVNTSNAENPLIDGLNPLLTVDVWEHAYYLKYQNRRPEYLENRWNLVDRNKVEDLYDK